MQVSAASDGHCVWYGQCPKSGTILNCNYTGSPKPLNSSAAEILTALCPMLNISLGKCAVHCCWMISRVQLCQVICLVFCSVFWILILLVGHQVIGDMPFIVEGSIPKQWMKIAFIYGLKLLTIPGHKIGRISISKLAMPISCDIDTNCFNVYCTSHASVCCWWLGISGSCCIYLGHFDSKITLASFSHY